MKTINIGDIQCANDKPFVLFGGMNVLKRGPCNGSGCYYQT